MIEIGNGLDGTVEKAISATEKLNGLPKFVQKFALAGDFSLGSAKKIDLSNYTSDSKEFENYIALISTLDKKQRDLIVSMTTLGEDIKKVDIANKLKDLSDGTYLNGSVVEQVLKENDFSKAAVEGLTAVEGLKDATTGYGLALTSKAIPAMEQWINQYATSVDILKLQQDNIITGTAGNYKFSDSFVKVIKEKQKDIEVTKELINEEKVWNAVLQIGKQLLVSLAISAFIAGIQKLIKAIQDYRNRFVNGMNDAHDAAENAKSDIESIQAKIDELNEKVKAAGANQISDIADPTERAKLEALNENLEKQLKLKQQIQEIEEKKEHDNAVGVYNTKDETVYKDADGNYDYSMGIATDSAGYKATSVEALDYYNGMLNEYTKRYNDLLVTTKDENDPTLVSTKEQMDFAADEVARLSNSLGDLQGHLSDTSDEYSAIATVLGKATDALSYYNGEITVSAKESRLGRQLRYEQTELNKTTSAYKKYTELQEHYGKYGNIDNFNRGIVEWTDENLNKYSQFAEENDAKKGDYSTVNGRSVNVNELNLNSDAKEQFSGEIAFSPMLQTEDGVVPLTNDQIENYLRDVIETAAKMDGGATPENILKVDKEGLLEDINDVEISVNNMIAAVEGQILNGAKLSALDVIAIAGATEEELGDEFGNQWSKYFGYSMHDVQSQAVDLCKVIKSKWNDIWSDGVDTTKFNEQLSNSGNIQNALNLFGGSADAEYLKAIGQSGPKTKEQTEAFEILNKVAARLHTTYEKLIDAMEEEGIVASQSAVDTTAMSEASSKLDEVQAAYKSLRDAQKEYNKQGYLTADTLQSIIDLDPKYQACLIEENGKLNINKGTIKNLTNSYYELMKAKVYSQAIDDLKEMDTYQKAVDFLGQAKQETKDWLSLMQATANVTLETSGLSGEGWDKLNEAQQARIKTAQTMVDLISQTQTQSLDKQFPDSSTSKSTKDTKTVIDAWSTLSSAMKEYNEQGYITFQTLKSLTDLEDKYSSMLKKNDVTGQLEMRTDDFYELMKAELKEAQIKGDGASEAQYNKILEWTDRNIKNQTMSYWDLVAAIEGYSAALSEAKEITDGFKDAWSNDKTVKEKIEKSRTGALDYEGTEAQSSALQTLKKYSEYDPNLISNAYNKETGKIDLSGDTLKTAVVKSLQEQAAAARTEGGEAAAAIADSYDKAAYNIEHDVISVQDYFEGLGSTIDDVSSKIDDMQSAWSDLADVTNEYNTYGGLSVDSIQKLLTMSSDYLQFLIYDGKQLTFNRDAMIQFAQANLKAKADQLALKDETKDQAVILEKLADSLGKGTDAMQGMGTEAEKLNTTLSNLKSVFSDLVSLFNSGASNQTNDLQLWADALNDEIDERIDKLDKQEEALEKENEAEERAIELTKAQDALARAQSQHTARVYGGNGYEWEASSADVRSAQQDLDDKRRQYRQADAKQAIEDEKKALNDLKDEYAKITKLIGKSLKDYNKQMKYTAQIQAMTLQDMKDSMTDYKDSVLENMKLVSAGTSMSDALSNLEKLISTLETLNDIYTAVSSHLQNTDGGDIIGLAKNLNTLGEDIYNKGFGTAMKDFLGKFKDDVWETLATSDNSIVQMFRNAWTLIEDGAAKFFTSEGLGKTIAGGLQNIGGSIGNWVGSLVTNGGVSAGTTSLAGVASSLPVIGAIAVGVNNIFQQTKKTVDENEKLWSDTSKSTSEKIVGSLGNILYHLSPVEGWDKSIQYAKKAAEGDGIWEKISNGFKSVYYGCGLGVMLDNIWTTIKAIFNIQDKASKEADSKSTTTSTELDNKNLSVSTTTTKTTELTDPTEDSTKKKKWYESKVWFWNWGKKATGDKSIKKSNLYNVDEQGSELIVRQPASGRYTYLETGDGVVPADITSKLFEMGGNPDKWFSDQMAKYSTNGIQTRNVDSSRSISVGDVVVNNPVGDADALARALVQKLPSAIDQQMNKR